VLRARRGRRSRDGCGPSPVAFTGSAGGVGLYADCLLDAGRWPDACQLDAGRHFFPGRHSAGASPSSRNTLG